MLYMLCKAQENIRYIPIVFFFVDLESLAIVNPFKRLCLIHLSDYLASDAILFITRYHTVQ